MRIIKREPLLEFGRRFPRAVAPLDIWYRIAAQRSWRNFSDVKSTFGQTDAVKVRSGNTVLVFDIGGNKFRLIAAISYPKGKVYVLRVLTHKEYDTDRWKAEL